MFQNLPFYCLVFFLSLPATLAQEDPSTLESQDKNMEISQISNLVPLDLELKNTNPNTLVIFDIDEVLIIPTDEFRLTHHYRKELIKGLEQRLTYEERKNLYSIILNQQEYRFVDKNILQTLNYLKKRSIPTIALTKSFTSKLGIIESIADHLIESLMNLGISFQETSPINKEIMLPEIESEHGAPLFKAGILMTAKADKGESLKYLMKKAGYRPERIIFIDNDINNLRSVQKTCHEMNILFHGYEYTAAAFIQEANLDAEKEKKRFEILEKKHRWLTDSELSEFEL